MLRVEIAVCILPGREQVFCLSTLCLLSSLSVMKIREKKAALVKCRAGSPAKGLSLKEVLGSSWTDSMSG